MAFSNKEKFAEIINIWSEYNKQFSDKCPICSNIADYCSAKSGWYGDYYSNNNLPKEMSRFEQIAECETSFCYNTKVLVCSNCGQLYINWEENGSDAGLQTWETEILRKINAENLLRIL